MSGSKLVTDGDKLNSLFPFHILIDSACSIESCGMSLKKLYGNCLTKPFSECFQLIRPVEIKIDFKTLVDLCRSLVIIGKKDCQANIPFIRGQFEYFSNEKKLLFVGAPWFDSIEDLIPLDLKVNDFAYHDSTVDFLYRIKNQEIINSDLEKLVGMINLQKRKLTEAELITSRAFEKEKELNKMKSSFVSMASHEFRTPLACIRSSVEIMQINSAQSGRVPINIERHHNNILSEIDNLCDLINEVLTVGKIEAESFFLTRTETDLANFSRVIIEKVSSLQDDGRSVTLKTRGIPKIIMADQLLLTHILTNLLTNSFKYSQGKIQPVFTIIYRKHEVQIKVKDFGIGIPVQELPNVFNVFFRASNVQHISGTGLGLFITKNFVELHGGQISLKSVSNKGTEFIFRIPSPPQRPSGGAEGTGYPE